MWLSLSGDDLDKTKHELKVASKAELMAFFFYILFDIF